MKQEVLEQVDELKDNIKEKDLEQLATTNKFGIKFLISYNKDFENFEEYLTLKKFLEKLKINCSF